MNALEVRYIVVRWHGGIKVAGSHPSQDSADLQVKSLNDAIKSITEARWRVEYVQPYADYDFYEWLMGLPQKALRTYAKDRGYAQSGTKHDIAIRISNGE